MSRKLVSHLGDTRASKGSSHSLSACIAGKNLKTAGADKEAKIYLRKKELEGHGLLQLPRSTCILQEVPVE